jgi:large subunit ribosomal protein L23
MALLKKDTKETEKAIKKPAAKKVAPKKTKASEAKLLRTEKHGLYGVLKKPYITEKAAVLSENRVYTFEIRQDAGKGEVAAAIRAFYGVDPVRVNIIKLPAKQVMSRGRRGTKPAMKKAMVFLKKGDSIEFV